MAKEKDDKFYDNTFYEEEQEEEEEFEQPEYSRKSWQQKLQERTFSAVQGNILLRQRIIASRARKKVKIRKNYKTNWIWDILDSNPRPPSKNALIKANLTSPSQQHMLNIMECLGIYAMKFFETGRFIQKNEWGLSDVLVDVRENNKYVKRTRLPILVELDKQTIKLIADQIGISEGQVWKNIQGLEAKGFVVPVGKKRGMKGQLRMIGTFFTGDKYVLTKDEETGKSKRELHRTFIKSVYLWGRGQKDVMERLAQLKKAK